jgi:hypothetical protein
MSIENASTGKIGRLPWEIREEVNRRLRDGQPARKIIDWLHSLPEVLRVLDEYFGEEPINDQNVSVWRKTGYAKWMARQGAIDRTKELADFSMKVATAAGGSLADGAAQILAGSVLEVLEGLESLRRATGDIANEETPEQAKERLASMAGAIDSLVLAVARLRKGDQGAEALRLARDKVAQAEKALALEREKHEQRLREYEEKVKATKRAIESELTTARTGGLTPETLKRIEEAAALL